MEAIIRPDGLLMLRGGVFRTALGARGVSAFKQEGDKTTPAGVLPLRRVLYRADRLRPPSCTVALEPIGQADGWCDDPDHRDYNRMVRLPHDASCEALWREDAVYDVIGVLGWNDQPVVRGRGSAIFLHVARPDYAPTDGCVALSLADLRHVLSTGLTSINILT